MIHLRNISIQDTTITEKGYNTYTEIYINPTPLVLQDHKFYFTYRKESIERKFLFFKKKKVENYRNVLVAEESREIIKNFSEIRCVPGETILDCGGYFNIGGNCLISKTSKDSISYELTRLPRIMINYTYEKCPYYKDISFRSLSDLEFYIKYLIDCGIINSNSLYQNVSTCELITDIDKYLLNLVQNGK